MIVETSSGSRYLYEMRTNKITVCDENNIIKPMLPVNFGEVGRVDTLSNIDTFILELTQDCNFRCSYCCYGGKYVYNRRHSSKEMSDDILHQTIQFIARNRVPDRKLNIVFYGGEPLLAFGKIKNFVCEASKDLPEDIEYTISTNGSLLSMDGVLDWCITNDVTLNISFDGCESVSERLTKGGNSSHSGVLKILETISRRSPEYWESNVNLLVTVSRIENLIIIAKEWGRNHVLKAKAPYLISGISPCELSDFEVNEDNTLATLRTLIDYFACNRDNIFIKAYLDLLCSPVIDRKIFQLPEGYSPLMCLPYNTRCYIDVDGNLGICEKTPDKLRIGDVFNGWNFEMINEAIQKMAFIRKSRCAECEMLRLCKTCFTNYFYEEERWVADCQWQKAWNRMALTISLDVLERGLLDTTESQSYSMREILETDISSIHRIMSKPSVMKYVDGLDIFENCEQSLRFFLLISEINVSFASSTLYAIVNEESKMVGIVGVDEIHADVGNLFFLLEDDCWGNGIMTKILAEYLQKYVPDTVKMITTHINPQNEAALRLASKFSKIEVLTS